MAREWKCKRCNDSIDILVPDEERKFVIDGDSIFCGPTCRTMFKQYVPVDPVRKKINQRKKVGAKKKKNTTDKTVYKCFNCNNTTERRIWNNLCPICIKVEGVNMYNIRLFKVSE